MPAATSGAGEALQRIAKPERESARWHLLASKAYDGIDDPKRAVEEAEAALALEFHNEAHHLQLAQIFLTRNTPRPAYDILTEALAVFPDSLLVRLGRGLAAKELQRFDEAGRDLLECVKRKPGWALAFDAIGAVYLQSNRAEDLVAVAASYRDRNPGDFRGYYYLAEGRSALGLEDAETERLVRRSIALNGSFAAARGLLGKILYQRRQLAEALPELEQAVRLRPDFTPSRMRLAKAYQQLGRAEDAAREFAFIRKLKIEERQPAPALLYHRGKKKP